MYVCTHVCCHTYKAVHVFLNCIYLGLLCFCPPCSLCMSPIPKRSTTIFLQDNDDYTAYTEYTYECLTVVGFKFKLTLS